MREHDHVVNGTTTLSGVLGWFLDLPPVRRHVYFYLCLILATVAIHRVMPKHGPIPPPEFITYNP